jgi:hypothetical protein
MIDSACEAFLAGDWALLGQVLMCMPRLQELDLIGLLGWQPSFSISFPSSNLHLCHTTLQQWNQLTLS